MTTYTLLKDGVQRDDGATIPNAPGNMDWDAYQKWLTEGGVPHPLSPGPQYDWDGNAWVVNAQRQLLIDAGAKLGIDLASVKGNNPIVQFLQMSPAEIDAYINTNITGANVASVNSIKTILAVLAKVVSVVARDTITR